MLVFLLSSPGILFLLSSLSNEIEPIGKKIYCRHCYFELSGKLPVPFAVAGLGTFVVSGMSLTGMKLVQLLNHELCRD